MLKLPTLAPSEIERLCHDPAYDHVLLRRYKFWNLYLNERNQSHLGRAYAWLSNRHVDCHALDDLQMPELAELMSILSTYRVALTSITGICPTLINCEWLGNEVSMHRGHGHMHFLPRFAKPPVWCAREYRDHRYGRRADYAKSEMARPDLLKLVSAFRQELAR